MIFPPRVTVRVRVLRSAARRSGSWYISAESTTSLPAVVAVGGRSICAPALAAESTAPSARNPVRSLRLMVITAAEVRVDLVIVQMIITNAVPLRGGPPATNKGEIRQLALIRVGLHFPVHSIPTPHPCNHP